jgi:exonuclease SbcC
MIKRVKLENFACHEKTELKLPEGLIIFLGRNGAGKSSVIDAITYALYGEHSRGNNTNIVRDGAEGGKVELEFSLGGVDYRVLRQFNSKGVLEHAYLKSNSRILATGERKREGDDVAQQIRRLLGINYNQMLSAVVIQQGELDRILSEEPRNHKEPI